MAVNRLRQIKAHGKLPAKWVFGWVFIGYALLGAIMQGVFASTPNEVLSRGTPTFVVGTGGSEREDKDIETQARMVRDLIFPNAEILTDSGIDHSKGATAWPANAVVYGGPHVNKLLKGVASSLPFKMEAGKLILGDQEFAGGDYRLITVVPARAADTIGPGYPEFLLYAGTGSPGVAEINAVRHGADGILVADRFGVLLTGRWVKNSGEMVPEFKAGRARRIPWRGVSREVPFGAGAKGGIEVLFPTQLARDAKEAAVVDACVRGMRRVVQKLGLTKPARMNVYMYPDRGSKRSLTGNGGDGHAEVGSRSVHTVVFDTAEGGALENLIAHEATHVLAYEAWGGAGTALVGEGLAVWVSGQYGGVALDKWRERLPDQISKFQDMLGKGFHSMPEQQSYPLSGLFIGGVIEKRGVAGLSEHLFQASSSSWMEACRNFGMTAGELEGVWQRAGQKQDGEPGSSKR